MSRDVARLTRRRQGWLFAAAAPAPEPQQPRVSVALRVRRIGAGSRTIAADAPRLAVAGGVARGRRSRAARSAARRQRALARRRAAVCNARNARRCRVGDDGARGGSHGGDDGRRRADADQRARRIGRLSAAQRQRRRLGRRRARRRGCRRRRAARWRRAFDVDGRRHARHEATGAVNAQFLVSQLNDARVRRACAHCRTRLPSTCSCASCSTTAIAPRV